MKKYLACWIIWGMLSCSSSAWADVVCLANGNIIEGIILQEADNAVELEVFLNARITFAQNDVSYIKKWDNEKNLALRQKWLQDKQEREQAEQARQEFEAKQAAKGLVKHRGEWIPETERDKLTTLEYIDEVLQSKIDRGDIPYLGMKKRSDIARGVLAKGAWKNRQSEHFIVYYEDVMQSKMVADRAEYYYEKIAYDLDYEAKIYWPDKCEVFIVPSEEKWREYIQEFIERFEYVRGFVPGTGEKEIYLCSLSLPYLSVSFPHELTHLIFREFAQGAPIPLWLNEGLAIYESGLIGYADELLRDKVKEAKHIAPNEFFKMDNYPATKEEVELFYAQSEKTVEFLITQYGRKNFSKLCQLLIEGKPFEQALKLAYADKYRNKDEFNKDWIKYVLK